jgi:hypothetical protein
MLRVAHQLQSSAGLQVAQIAAAGTAAEKALLAEVIAKNPDTHYGIYHLLLFKARRRMGTHERSLNLGVCCIAPAARCLRTSACSSRTGPM